MLGDAAAMTAEEADAIRREWDGAPNTPRPAARRVGAKATRRGDVVYTTDVADLERLRVRFPNVRVLAV